MSLFIDKQKRRKSPLALAAFGAALLYLCVFGLCYAVLAEPLYRSVRLESPAATLAVHSAVVAAAGTAVCFLLFLLEDKRVAPLGFAGLAIVLGMFYAAALLLEGENRQLMLRLITMYGLAPVLVGNTAAWLVYWKIRRGNPAPKHRKTLRQELLEAAAAESAKEKPGEIPGRPAEGPAPEPRPMPEEAEFGPDPAAEGPGSFRSEAEDAMLLYMDDGDEENDD